MNHGVNTRTAAMCLGRVTACLLVVLTIAAPGQVLLGQDNGPGVPARRDARGVEMKQIVDSLSAHRGDGAGQRPIRLRSEPLLRWNDPTGHFRDASLWAWGDSGRPLAIVTLELYPGPKNEAGSVSWAFEFIALSPGSLQVQGDYGSRAKEITKSNQLLNGSINWTPAQPCGTFREIPGADPPAQTPRVRLAQMRELIRRFAATDHAYGEPTQLRLMPHPIDRYADPDRGQVDGTIFVLANGTNPEVMILIEAQGRSVEKSAWRFAVAPLTVAPFEVTFDRKEVWTEPYHSNQVNRPTSSYYTLVFPGKVRP